MRRNLGIPLACLVIASCGGAEDDPTEEEGVPNIPELQRLADEACLCEMAGNQSTQCWAQFEAARAGFPSEGFGTASDPLSFETVCFGDGNSDCVSVGARLIDGSNALVCTSQQIDEIEALHARVYENAGMDAKAADEAALARINELADEVSQRSNRK